MSSFSPLLLALVAGQSPVRKAALLAFEPFEDAIPLLSSATLAMAFFQWSGKISHQSQPSLSTFKTGSRIRPSLSASLPCDVMTVQNHLSEFRDQAQAPLCPARETAGD